MGRTAGRISQSGHGEHVEQGRRGENRADEIYLVISHPASDIHPEAIAEMTKRFNQRLGNVVAAGRTRDQVARFFTGLDPVEPGIVSTPKWRPDGIEPADDPACAAVGRKP